MTVEFSPEAERRFAEIRGRYPRKEAALLPVLWLAQSEFDHLSAEVRSYVAGRLDLPLSIVEGVVSFYTLYRTKPGAKHRIQICRNISCRLRGSEDLSAAFKAAATESVECCEVECLAACGGAPALRVDDDYFEKADAKDLERVIRKLGGASGEDR